MKPPKAAKYHVDRIMRKLTDREVSEELAFRKERMDRNHDGTNLMTWIPDRGYEKYDTFFSHGLYNMGLGKSIDEALIRIASRKKGTVRISDDGAGVGNFLSEIKGTLAHMGIKTKTTAIDLYNGEKLVERQRRGEIDEVFSGRSEFFLPKEKQDAIFSLAGSINYTINALRKDTLLKYANSLNKGGVLMLGFYFAEEPNIQSLAGGAIRKGLSEKPNYERKMKIETEMHGIERAFEKRGFRAKFFKYPEELASRLKLPQWMLILERIK
ncbi:MAG TPA: hypothetical protein VFF13_00825 [archaeon]|nr:hypothetical protein [archaeon]